MWRAVTVEVGKKVTKWGKGYAWNPVAFADRPKNPEDPLEALEGFYVLSADFVKSFQGPLKTLAFTPVVLPVTGSGAPVFDAERQTVWLTARRDGLVYSNLAHVFRRPTGKDKKAFRMQKQGGAVKVRGSVTDTTLLLSQLTSMARVYDQMLIEVNGYTVEGNPAGRQDAVQHMDALHKKIAVIALFNPFAED